MRKIEGEGGNFLPVEELGSDYVLLFRHFAVQTWIPEDIALNKEGKHFGKAQMFLCGIVTRIHFKFFITFETFLLRGVGRVRTAMVEKIMSLGTSAAKMKQEEKEEEKEEKEEEEQEDQGKVEMLMSQGASDLLHKPSFLSTALKISAATPPFSHIFIIGIPYSCVFFPLSNIDAH